MKSINHAVNGLLFLKKKKNLNSIILISSENGFLCFWSLTFKKEDRLLSNREKIKLKKIKF